MAKRKRKNWAESFGDYGNRIRIYEDSVSGILYAETADPSLKCGSRSVSLRHRDKERAVRWAKEQVAKLALGDASICDPTPTARRVVGFYLANQTSKKSLSEQQADRRRAELWLRFFGPRKDLRRITLSEWNRFIKLRCGGVIDSRGCEVAEDDRQTVRTGTAAADLVFLRSVLSWARKWQDPAGRYLLREDPTRGYPMPVEKNPRRPVVTTDRYQRVLKAAQGMKMVVHWGEKPLSVPSHLPSLLALAHGTGRRISAILKLRYQDLRLHDGPHGSIRWPADTDKMGKEWVVPISAEVREVLDEILEERPGIGKAWLFPAPTTMSKHLSKDVASAWLVKAEQVAKVAKQDGSLWHAYRRGWATARKQMPDVDVAASGGWSDVTSLKQCYQHADMETMYRVVSEPLEIREA